MCYDNYLFYKNLYYLVQTFPKSIEIKWYFCLYIDHYKYI